MKRELAAMSDQQFDLLIIGGGEEVLELVEREPKLGGRLCPQRPEIRAQKVQR